MIHFNVKTFHEIWGLGKGLCVVRSIAFYRKVVLASAHRSLSRSSQRGCFHKISVSPSQEVAFSRKSGKQIRISRKGNFLTVICFPAPADDIITRKQISISRQWLIDGKQI